MKIRHLATLLALTVSLPLAHVYGQSAQSAGVTDAQAAAIQNIVASLSTATDAELKQAVQDLVRSNRGSAAVATALVKALTQAAPSKTVMFVDAAIRGMAQSGNFTTSGAAAIAATAAESSPSTISIDSIVSVIVDQVGQGIRSDILAAVQSVQRAPANAVALGGVGDQGLGDAGAGLGLGSNGNGSGGGSGMLLSGVVSGGSNSGGSTSSGASTVSPR
jgi:hypothetical protein